MSAGECTVRVTPAGDSGTTVLEETVTLTDDAPRYTAAVAGQLADDSVASLLLADAVSNHDPRRRGCEWSTRRRTRRT